MKALWRKRLVEYARHRARLRAKIISASQKTDFIELNTTNEIINVTIDTCNEKQWVYIINNNTIKILFI